MPPAWIWGGLPIQLNMCSLDHVSSLWWEMFRDRMKSTALWFWSWTKNLTKKTSIFHKYCFFSHPRFSCACVIQNVGSNWFFHRYCTSFPHRNTGTWTAPCWNTAPSLPPDPHSHPSHPTILPVNQPLGTVARHFAKETTSEIKNFLSNVWVSHCRAMLTCRINITLHYRLSPWGNWN